MGMVETKAAAPAGQISARRRILDAANELFYRDGVRAVGIDAIIALSGVAKMSLYRHFPSKTDLIVAWLAERNEHFWQRWDQAAEARRGDAKGQIQAVVAMVAQRAARPEWRGCPFLNTSTEFPEPDHPARVLILQNKAEVLARLTKLAADAGAIDPDLLARQLQLAMDGAYVIGQTSEAKGLVEALIAAADTLLAAQTAD